MKKLINVALFGLGTVGQAVIRQLQQNRDLIEQQAGVPIRLNKIVVRSLNKKRTVDVTPYSISDDPNFILDDPEIDVVIELIGGTDLAETICHSALSNGKSFITANKALLAEKGTGIGLVHQKSTSFIGYEASVAAGTPILRLIRDGLGGNNIQSLAGIINGTSNYILDQMSETKTSFAEALKQAQEKGYAEADPSFDIQGNDAAHKLIILMGLAFQNRFSYKKLHIEGIEQIEYSDIKFAQELGYTIKHLGIARKTEKGIEGRVNLALLKKTHLMSTVKGVNNALLIKGDFSGPIILYGQGAGADSTSSGVVSDLIEICHNIKTQIHSNYHNSALFSYETKEMLPMDLVETSYYLRFCVFDQFGVMATISRVLADKKISIHKVIQVDKNESDTPIYLVIVTHQAVEKNVQDALKEINLLPFMSKPASLIRIEEDLE